MNLFYQRNPQPPTDRDTLKAALRMMNIAAESEMAARNRQLERAVIICLIVSTILVMFGISANSAPVGFKINTAAVSENVTALIQPYITITPSTILYTSSATVGVNVVIAGQTNPSGTRVYWRLDNTATTPGCTLNILTPTAFSTVITNFSQPGYYVLKPTVWNGSWRPEAKSVIGFVVTASSNQPPTITLDQPANGASYTAGQAIPIVTTPADADGMIQKVIIYTNSVAKVELTSAPWTNQIASAAAGVYVISATAFDDYGTSVSSASATVSVSQPPPNPQAPTITITSPANGATYETPANVVLTANASDPVALAGVIFFTNGVQCAAFGPSGPFTTTIAFLPGVISFLALATNNSALGDTDTVTFTVNAPPPTNQPPVIALTAPTEGQSFQTGTTITFSGAASDSDGTIASVSFWRAATMIGEDVSSPYSVGAVLPYGPHSVFARAVDNDGYSSTTTNVTIHVNADLVLTWNGSLSTAPDYASSFKLYQSINGAAFALLTTTTGNSYTNANLSASSRRFYATSVNAIGESAAGPVFSITVP